MRFSAPLARALRARRSAAAALLLVPLPLWLGQGGDVRAGAESAPTAVVHDPELRPLRAVAARSGAFDPQRAPFRLTVDGERVPYRVLAVLALPGRPVTLQVEGAGEGFALRHDAGVAVAAGAGRWRWTPPEDAGIHALRVEGPAGAVHLNALVLHPREEIRGGRMHGYPIGTYREEPLRGNPVYLPPRGFVEVGSGDADVLLSPHLSLGQFRCKQPGEPRYVHVTTALLTKLEAVLEAANAAGYDAPTLHVMSGFRTPAYNRAIGNTTSYSRHLWGDAADVWVDADGDGEMDDWNRDGRVDREDARILLRLAESVEGRDGVLPGGLGLYRRNAVHGPFVHVDARGYAARW